MKTLTEKFNAVNEGRYAKAQFLRDARIALPNLITQYNSYSDAVTILKNRGLLFETNQVETLSEELGKYKQEKAPEYTHTAEGVDMFPIEAVERGIDVELEKKGLSSVLAPSEEDYEKAKKVVLKNLEKDPNFYLHQLAGDHANLDTADEMVEFSEKAVVDKENGLQKVQLKEAIKSLIVSILAEDKISSTPKKRFNLEGKIY